MKQVMVGKEEGEEEEQKEKDNKLPEQEREIRNVMSTLIIK